MHPGATDSSGAGLSPRAGGPPAPGSAGGRQGPRGAGGGGWRMPAAVAALAAVALFFLGPGSWAAAGGAGPGTVLLRLGLTLSCAAAAFLLGTLFALVCRSPRARPPDFAAAWSRLAAHRPLGVSTGLAAPAPASGAISHRLPGPRRHGLAPVLGPGRRVCRAAAERLRSYSSTVLGHHLDR